MIRDLREYLELLEGRGLLRRVSVEVSPILEIPEILRRVMYRRGPALLFEKIRGYPEWRVAGNIFCSLDAVKLALGVDRLESIGERLVSVIAGPPPISAFEKLSTLREFATLAKFLPKRARRPAFSEGVYEEEKATLDAIPAFKVWPKDGGRYLTYPLVIVRDPESGITNIGVYRVMILDDKRAVIHWQVHKRGAEAFRRARERGLERLDVAIAIGGDPATMLAGVMPVPYPIDKLLFAGILRGEGIEVSELSSGLLVPARAEALLEGYVGVDELAREGPFGDHFGYYDRPSDLYPVFHLTRLHLRSDPIYYGTVTGKPALEDSVMGKAVERVFLPLIRTILPEVVEINLPEHGMFQGLAIVSIRKRFPGHAKRVMMALWGLGQLSLTKIVVVVDHDINPHDLNQVVWAVSANVDPQRDVLVVPGTHTDALDPATPIQAYGSKLGIDATRKLPEEHGGREWPEEVSVDDETARLVDERWTLYGID
uniref:Anhydromevalonate phosphate decarboxylase n=1 Tax=Fervidicoccus fontis TaxID=683846 RepID=A0A7J3ZIM0_9CREN